MSTLPTYPHSRNCSRFHQQTRGSWNSPWSSSQHESCSFAIPNASDSVNAFWVITFVPELPHISFWNAHGCIVACRLHVISTQTRARQRQFHPEHVHLDSDPTRALGRFTACVFHASPPH